MNCVRGAVSLVVAVTVQAAVAEVGPPDYGCLLPPKAVGALSEAQERGVGQRLEEVTDEFRAVRGHARAADVEIFLKAVRFALEFDEWYDKKPEDNLRKANALLDEAERRIAGLREGKMRWTEGGGQKVWGFYSRIDGSAQPYGVEIPEGVGWGEGKAVVPMWVWLHGRGDTMTDLNFTHSRLTAKEPGQFRPRGTVVVHPFGRYCNGYKSAGETDVLEAREDAWKRFNGDGEIVGQPPFPRPRV